MPTLSLRVIDDRSPFGAAEGPSRIAPGERLEVVAGWQFFGALEWIELRLVWSTQGKGTTDRSVVRTVRWDHPGQVDERRATFELPDGPYSFSGRLISLAWSLELVTSDGAAERREIVVAPDGHEILLDAGSGP